MAAGHRPLWISLVPRPHCKRVGSNSGNETSWPRVRGSAAVVQCSLAVSSFFATTFPLLWNKDIALRITIFYRTSTKWREATPWQRINPPGISILNGNGIL